MKIQEKGIIEKTLTGHVQRNMTRIWRWSKVPIKGRLERGDDPLIPGGDRKEQGIKGNHGTGGSQSGKDPMKEPPKAGISTCIYYEDKYPGLGIKGLKYLWKILLFFVAYYTQLPYDRNWLYINSFQLIAKYIFLSLFNIFTIPFVLSTWERTRHLTYLPPRYTV